MCECVGFADVVTLCVAGPSNWHRTYPSCAGSSQSPVNIDRSQVVFSGSLTTFDIPGYETIPRGAHWQLHNSGRTGWYIYTPRDKKNTHGRFVITELNIDQFFKFFYIDT